MTSATSVKFSGYKGTLKKRFIFPKLSISFYSTVVGSTSSTSASSGKSSGSTPLKTKLSSITKSDYSCSFSIISRTNLYSFRVLSSLVKITLITTEPSFSNSESMNILYFPSSLKLFLQYFSALYGSNIMLTSTP